jgi:hypothetical protein
VSEVSKVVVPKRLDTNHPVTWRHVPENEYVSRSVLVSVDVWKRSTELFSSGTQNLLFFFFVLGAFKNRIENVTSVLKLDWPVLLRPPLISVSFMCKQIDVCAYNLVFEACLQQAKWA